ncbi:YbaY family lipoprotein [uncultured Cohaesibacter sp.]|uniref:YbaY family lipoprotein n=1 Tax=uncultured Cohaesibacter sp. TaxID=1002546 RepID=UPI0029C84FF7|nr:YbaY family lipoprotein [uncultured Cohaesibacter sp.]
MVLAYKETLKADFPFGPFPSPYGGKPENDLFESLLNSRLRGEVYASHEARLPKNAMLELQLLDISEDNEQGVTLAKSTIVLARSLPLLFQIPYDSADIKRAHTYSISGTIHAGGKLLYASRDTHLVFTDSNFSFVRLCLSAVD